MHEMKSRKIMQKHNKIENARLKHLTTLKSA